MKRAAREGRPFWFGLEARSLSIKQVERINSAATKRRICMKGSAMQSIEILGYAASVASGGAFLPQAIRALRTRRTQDLSLSSVGLGATGTVLWACYGLAIESGPVTASNVIVMPFAMATLVMKLRSD